MADFEVRYNISVISAGAIESISALQRATRGLQQVQQRIGRLNQSVHNLNQRLMSMQKKPYQINIDTTKAQLALKQLMTQAQQVKAAITGTSSTAAKAAIAGKKGTTASSTSASKAGTTVSKPSPSGIASGGAMVMSASAKSAAKTSYARARNAQGVYLPPSYAGIPTAPVAPATPMLTPIPGKATSAKTTRAGSRSVQARNAAVAARPKGVSNIGYRVLGPAMIDSGGIGALSMLKGMGIMYGISGLGAAMGNAVSDYVDYNNTMTTTRGILESHDNRSNFAGRFMGMERIARNIGRRTKFTAPEVAGATKFLAMAGFNIEDINRSMPTIANMALVADTDIARTADLVTNILTAYRLPTNKITNMADVMTMGFTMSNTTLEEMAESYKYFASIGSAHDLDFKELTAMIGLLGDAGIKGSSAGTAIRQIMSNMLKQSKPQAETWKSLGINPVGEDGKLRPMMDIFGELAEKNATLKAFNLFRVTAAQGATSLIQDQGSIKKWQRMYEEMQHADGITEKLATNRIENLEGKWMQIKSTFEDVAMTVMQSITPEAEGMMDRLLRWLNSSEASQVIGDLTRGLFDLMKAIGEITAAFLDLYHKFGPLINTWLQLQLILSAVLVPLRIIKSLFFGGLGIIALSTRIGGLTSSFAALFSAISNRRWGAAWGQMRNGFNSMASGAGLATSAAKGGASPAANPSAVAPTLLNGALARSKFAFVRPGSIGANKLDVNGWSNTISAYSRLRLSPEQQNVLATHQWAMQRATERLGRYKEGTTGYKKVLGQVNSARQMMHSTITQMMPNHMAKIDAINARISDYNRLKNEIQSNSNQLSKLRGRRNTWQQQSRLQAEIRRQQAQLANMAKPAALRAQIAGLQGQIPLVQQQQAHAHKLTNALTNQRIGNAPHLVRPVPVNPRELYKGIYYENNPKKTTFIPPKPQKPQNPGWLSRMSSKGSAALTSIGQSATFQGLSSMFLGGLGGMIGYESGGALGALAGGLGGMAIPALMGAGPVGWVGAAALGVTGLVLSIKNAAENAEKAMNNLRASLNTGTIYGSEFIKGDTSDMMKHYQLMYDGNLSVNDLVRLRLEMLHSIHDEENAMAEEELRRSSEAQRSSNAEEAFNQLNDTITWYQNLLGDSTAAGARIIESYAEMMPGQKFWDVSMGGGLSNYIDYTGKAHKMPVDIGEDNSRVAYALAAASFKDQANQAKLKKYQDEFAQLSSLGNRADMWAYYNRIKQERDSQLQNIPSALMPENFTYEKLSQLTPNEMASSFFARDIHARQLNPIVLMMEKAINAVDQWEAAKKSGNITVSDIQAYAFGYNTPLKSLTAYNTSEWYKQIGYDQKNKTFVDWQGVDVFGNAKSATAFDMAKSFVEEYTKMIEIFKTLPNTAQPAANSILEKYKVVADQAEAFMKKSGQSQIFTGALSANSYGSNYSKGQAAPAVTNNTFSTPMNITVNGRLLASEKQEIMNALGPAIDQRIKQAATASTGGAKTGLFSFLS